jgi:hypothetical protein
MSLANGTNVHVDDAAHSASDVEKHALAGSESSANSIHNHNNANGRGVGVEQEKELQVDGDAVADDAAGERNGKDMEKVVSKQPSAYNAGAIPDGGLVAWLQVLGAFFLFFNSWYVDIVTASTLHSPAARRIVREESANKPPGASSTRSVPIRHTTKPTFSPPRHHQPSHGSAPSKPSFCCSSARCLGLSMMRVISARCSSAAPFSSSSAR